MFQRSNSHALDFHRSPGHASDFQESPGHAWEKQVSCFRHPGKSWPCASEKHWSCIRHPYMSWQYFKLLRKFWPFFSFQQSSLKPCLRLPIQHTNNTIFWYLLVGVCKEPYLCFHLVNVTARGRSWPSSSADSAQCSTFLAFPHRQPETRSCLGYAWMGETQSGTS